MLHPIRTLKLAIVTLLFTTTASAQPSSSAGLIIPLYKQGSITSLGVPEIREQLDKSGDRMIRNVSEPTLELFRPAAGKANGTAVIIAPGGGFVGLGYDAGGTAVARRLTQHGITAFVLKYRTIQSATDPMHMPEVHMKEMDTLMSRAKSGLPVQIPRFAGEQHAVEDGARAIRLIRQRAGEWGIDRKLVGFIGFSAGAFLATDLAIGDKVSRPDFVALFYGGLRTPVPADAPPAFIAAAGDDEYQPNDAVQLYIAWRRSGVAAELHVYERGGHGFDLKPKGATSDHWFDDLVWWMRSRGLIEPLISIP